MIVPLLITIDLEVANDHDLADQHLALEMLHRDFLSIGVSSTIFVTGNASKAFASEVRQLSLAGHEIACHGLTHQKDENFRIMPRSQIQDALYKATLCIEQTVGKRPRSFRGPSMTTSVATQRALVEAGYEADFSVCPQRLDLLTCRGASLGWLTAPRVPYHPSYSSPYRRGDIELLVVPLSSFGLPLVSGLLYLFGYSFVKTLFRLLLIEARKIGAPIVYLFHSYEFARFVRNSDVQRPFHHRCYLADPKRRYALQRRFLNFMLAHKEIEPMISSDFVKDYKQRIGS